MQVLTLTVLLFSYFTRCRSIVEIIGIECSSDGNICTQSYCSLSSIGPNLSYANFGFFITRPQNNAFVQTQFYNRFGNQFVEAGPKFYESICNVTDVRSGSRKFGKMLPIMKPNTFNFPCPFQSYIAVKDMHPDSVLLPRFVKTQDYKVQISIGDIDANRVYFNAVFYMYSNRM